jgi:hypothetical protein
MAKRKSAGIIIRVSGVRVPPPACKKALAIHDFVTARRRGLASFDACQPFACQPGVVREVLPGPTVAVAPRALLTVRLAIPPHVRDRVATAVPLAVGELALAGSRSSSSCGSPAVSVCRRRPYAPIRARSVVVASVLALAFGVPGARAASPTLYTAPDGTQIAFRVATIKNLQDIEVPVTCLTSATGQCLIPGIPDAPGHLPRYAGIYRWPHPDLSGRTLNLQGPYGRPFWGPLCGAGCLPGASENGECLNVTDRSCLYIPIGQSRTLFFQGWDSNSPKSSRAYLRWRTGVLYARVCGDITTCNTFMPDTQQRWGILTMDSAHAYFPPVPYARGTKLIVRHGAASSITVRAAVRCSAAVAQGCVVQVAAAPTGLSLTANGGYQSEPKVIPHGAVRTLTLHFHAGSKRDKDYWTRLWRTARSGGIGITACDRGRPYCNVHNLRPDLAGHPETPLPALEETANAQTSRVPVVQAQ